MSRRIACPADISIVLSTRGFPFLDAGADGHEGIVLLDQPYDRGRAVGSGGGDDCYDK